MPIYELGTDHILELTPTTFANIQIRERHDLQRLLREHIEIIVPGGLVIAEEFCDWVDSSRRIDLLVLDQKANLVVVELKRTEDGGHLELQAIRYAAMISSMTWDQCVEAHRKYRQKTGQSDEAEVAILNHLRWDEPKKEEFAQAVRIVLVSAGFSPEVTTTVLWLNSWGLDIRCLQLIPHQYSDKVLLDIQQLIPLREEGEYQVRVREKVTEERIARIEQGKLSERNLEFWEQLLKLARENKLFFQDIAPTGDHWIRAFTVHGCNFNYVTVRNAIRIELYLNRKDPTENKTIFDHLFASKAEIEAAFGELLKWQRHDNKKSCRIYYFIPEASIEDRSKWNTLHQKMIALMTRFESAFHSHLERHCVQEGFIAP